jgi:hypothetical protein
MGHTVTHHDRIKPELELKLGLERPELELELELELEGWKEG